MKAACKVIGGQAESAAKDLCPVDTGLLRNSITHGMAGDSLSITEYADNKGNQTGQYASDKAPESKDKYVVMVGSNVHYAPFVELGTYKMDAKPYLRPAFENNAEGFKTIVEDILKG